MSMSILGIIISSFVIGTDVLLVAAYIFCVHTKRIYVANSILHFSLLHLLFSLAMLSWGLVLINQGFEIIWISINFDLLIIFLIAFIIYFSILDTYLRKKLIYPNKGVALLGRTLLPGVIVICFSACMVLYYYTINYYEFIKPFIG